ncbi:hypothetical protein DOY81_001729, partial [Sarcophaga bullata]
MSNTNSFDMRAHNEMPSCDSLYAASAAVKGCKSKYSGKKLQHRRLSYSRHAVDDRDLSTQVNYKMQMNFRRMFNDRKHHKRSKRGANKHQDGVKQNHVSFHDFQQNGTTKQFSHGTSKNESILRKKLIRKHSHNSLNKYRRLEI